MQKGGNGGGSATAAPTGCFKCGMPGHWSRDCPSSSSSLPILNPKGPNLSSTGFSKPTSQPRSGDAAVSAAAAATVKKPRRMRPKLTPDILLSEDGFGYVLRHFPRAFKCHGRGHEVSDLGKLIGLYAEWHSRLLPYYSFDQFVQKVEKLGATRRVRRCVSELKDRVRNGGDISKLHEPPVESMFPDDKEDGADEVDVVDHHGDSPMDSRDDADEMQEQMVDAIYQNATEEPCQFSKDEASPEKGSMEEPPSQAGTGGRSGGDGGCEPDKIQITEEQRARMEANRLKAVERAAAARARSMQPS